MQKQITKRPTNIASLICIVLVLVSCTLQAEQPSSPTEQFSITAASTTYLPTSTASSTLTKVLTATPIPTITLTPPPTLSLEQSDREISQLMQNDIDCEPPCFLGIIPEQTALGELQNIAIRFGLPLSNYQGTVYGAGNESDEDRKPDTQFFVQNGIVESIMVNMNQRNEFEWSLYSPASVIKRLGAPSFVMFWLGVVHEPTPTPWKAWYDMTFYYDNLDFIIEYGFPEVRLGEIITVCPNKDTFEYTRLWLGKYPDHAPQRIQEGSVEQVSPFTLQRFSDYLLLGPGACFYLKGKVVPIL